ncbi:imidazolonepropionase-like amidohydrolase [Krasilnikovia cinnamomea]|uniref:Imidazolonepropionase-like amidohydrolase n=1 Tax=Krasilnikovia cinnamomea TaxID=349313 RepID=A0A4Q7ZI31_9ACTN|nr:amidohydrolase family protein [Krasilnikovia cinnamomea]RZU49759.1 imidazolonepropionase-like amidohydrolase [Krasilnikovia cinnamomea]
MALHVRGVLLPDDEVRDLWLVGDRVTFEPVADAETISDSGYVLPGLVDAHCHLGIQYGGRPIEHLDQARELATTDRDAGVLAIRDAGSPYPYPELDDEPGMPRLARAGRHVAAPKRYLRDIGVEVDGADVAAAVTEQARAGTGWVKLVGDWIDRSVGDLAPSWDPQTMAAAVAAAHAAGARAAVHTFSEEGVAQMVRAGVDSVEHGTGLSFDLIDEMARRGTALVPTMINIQTFGGIADRARAKFAGYADHMVALRDRFPSVVRAAHEAGVPIYVGTDAGGGIRHGQAAEEMLLLHEAGIPALDVLAAASWRARAWLGFPGLVEGGRADLVVYPEDPRRDLTVVRAPRRIVLRGQVIR